MRLDLFDTLELMLEGCQDARVKNNIDKAGNQRPDSPDHDNLLRATEVAHLLGISLRNVWLLSSSGKLPPPMKIGRSTRWRNSDIQGVIRGGEGSDGSNS